MTTRLRSLGWTQIFLDKDGSLLIDQDSLRRNDFSRHDDEEIGFEFGYHDDDDWDDDEDDDFGYDEDDEDDDDEEFGATRGQQRRRSRRAKRKRGRAGRKRRRADKLDARADALDNNGGGGRKKRRKAPMQQTILSEVATTATAGATVVKIQLNHTFVAEDISFEGSSSGAIVSMITFGDRLVWNSPTGTPVSLLSASSRVRGLLKGAKANSGQFITVTGTTAADGDKLYVNVIGKKPAGGSC